MSLFPTFKTVLNVVFPVFPPSTVILFAIRQERRLGVWPGQAFVVAKHTLAVHRNLIRGTRTRKIWLLSLPKQDCVKEHSRALWASTRTISLSPKTWYGAIQSIKSTNRVQMKSYRCFRIVRSTRPLLVLILVLDFLSVPVLSCEKSYQLNALDSEVLQKKTVFSAEFRFWTIRFVSGY